MKVAALQLEASLADVAEDLPTMWENAFYVGGHDDGRIAIGATDVGVALCWELMRAQTARRLRGQVDAGASSRGIARARSGRPPLASRWGNGRGGG